MASDFLVGILVLMLWCHPLFVKSALLGSQVGRFVNSREVWTKAKSPYLVSWNIIVTDMGELVLEPGVEVRFSVGVGLTVQGSIRAQGNVNDRIVFTHEKGKHDGQQSSFSHDIRLVDGPSVSRGALQLYHNQKWRYVCASRNWTEIDFNVACRNLGFSRGEFYEWFDKNKHLDSLEYSFPNCKGHEYSIRDCDWSSRRMGKGTCDFNSFMGIRCIGQLNTTNLKLTNWRGVWFKNSKFEEATINDNRLYVKKKVPASVLEFVDILNAGYDKSGNLTSALIITGVAPRMQNVSVKWSAYNAVNLSECTSDVEIRNSIISENRGDGIVMNKSSGELFIRDTEITRNGGDGIRINTPEFDDILTDVQDFRSSPNLNLQQQFPVNFLVLQPGQPFPISDFRTFVVVPGRVLTVRILKMKNSIDNSGVVTIYDGQDKSSNILLQFVVSNSTKPPTVVTTGPHLTIDVRLNPSVEVEILLQVDAGYVKTQGIHISDSQINRNNGVGVYVRNLTSMVEVKRSVIEGNTHLGGVVVDGGSGDVNITDSWVINNLGDGVNITMDSGRSNLTRSRVGKNMGYGLAVWLSRSSPLVSTPQRTLMTNCEVYENQNVAVLIGKHWSNSLINITMTNFKFSPNIALKIITVENDEDLDSPVTDLFITNNEFSRNDHVSVEIDPPLTVNGLIEYNTFTDNKKECLVLKNTKLIRKNLRESKIIVQENEFEKNQGMFVVALGLPESEINSIHFTHNYVRWNEVKEPFPSINPRSNVAAVVVISSTNVNVYRNIFDNHRSKFDIGSHVVGREKTLNCSLNAFGTTDIKIIDDRIFDCKYRFHLACVQFKPYLKVFSDFDTEYLSSISEHSIHLFRETNSKEIGGEVQGRIELEAGEYIVKKDIFVPPRGELHIKSNVRLIFESSLGMIVQGKVEMKGYENEPIMLTSSLSGIAVDLTQVRLMVYNIHADQNTEFIYGRLEMKVKEKWGTVCNHGWTQETAALVCHQMGYFFNPVDWDYKAGIKIENLIYADIVASNVRCHFLDERLQNCKFDGEHEIENTCTHEDDVYMRCYKPRWLGVRFGLAADEGVVEHVTIENAGYYDYHTQMFQSALQMDLMHHRFTNIQVRKNMYAGIGVVFNDFFDNPEVFKISQCNVSNNVGHGIFTHTPGLKIGHSFVTNNTQSGVHLDPHISRKMRQELFGWIVETKRMSVKKLNHQAPENVSQVQRGNSVSVITEKMPNNSKSALVVTTDPASIFGLQVFNPFWDGTDDVLEIVDGRTKTVIWKLNDNVTNFPAVVDTSILEINYFSHHKSLGGAVIYITSIGKSDQLNFAAINPQLKIYRSLIASNRDGVRIYHYDADVDQDDNWNARVQNQSIEITHSSVENQQRSAMRISSELALRKNDIMVNNTYVLIETLLNENNYTIAQRAGDLINSRNVFTWKIRNCRFENNANEVINVTVPYVWNSSIPRYHQFDFIENVFVANKNFQFIINGYYSKLRMINNRFLDNKSPVGLISIRGMEKEIWLTNNVIELNWAKYLVKFDMNSHTKLSNQIDAYFKNNKVFNNSAIDLKYLEDPLGSDFEDLNFAVGVFGIQNVNLTNNFLGPNDFDYLFVSGMKSNSIKDFIDVRENWWGTDNVRTIWSKILDSDDSYNFATAEFIPFQKFFDISSEYLSNEKLPFLFAFDDMGGPVRENMVLGQRDTPYVVKSDLTIMPGVTLTIHPGVEITFKPNVGILVLGRLVAKGTADEKIIMRPEAKRSSRSLSSNVKLAMSTDVRLCFDGKCTDSEEISKSGFLEVYNQTTKQWIPVCDGAFSEKSADVVCNQLTPEVDVFAEGDVKFGRRYDLDEKYINRIQTWYKPSVCSGQEPSLLNCIPRRKILPMTCNIESNFVFIHCNFISTMDVRWGGITFAPANYDPFVAKGIADFDNKNNKKSESILEYVILTEAGNLHGNKVSAIQALYNPPKLFHTEIINSASHGVTIIAPKESIDIQYSTFIRNRGVGLNIIDFRRAISDSPFKLSLPVAPLYLPKEMFGMVDLCDSDKVISINDRVLVYYKYGYREATCVKVFRGIDYLGFRLLHLNLFRNYGADVDFVKVFSGDNMSNETEELLKLSGEMNESRIVVKSKLSTLSVQIVASSASEMHGFVAEIFSVPPVSFSADDDYHHVISHSEIAYNNLGAIIYSSSGEVNPKLSISANLINSNGFLMAENFTSIECAVALNLQNSLSVIFENNAVVKNQGGLCIRSESDKSSHPVQAQILNNLFTENINHPSLKIISHSSLLYQVLLRSNIFTFNNHAYSDAVSLNEVVSRSITNYFSNNTGRFTLNAAFDSGRSMETYQFFIKNIFVNNTSLHQKTQGTILIGSGGQSYRDNTFENPANHYELVTTTGSGKINASHNWWGYNTTFAIFGRIRDNNDDKNLLEVISLPFHENPLIDGNCLPGWKKVGADCHQYVGGYLTQSEAELYCNKQNATVSYVKSKLISDFVSVIHTAQPNFDNSIPVRIQTIEFVPSSRCSAIINGKITTVSCSERYPFLCAWGVDWAELAATKEMNLAILIGACAGGAFVLLLCISVCICRARHARRAKESYSPNRRRQDFAESPVSKQEMVLLTKEASENRISEQHTQNCTPLQPQLVEAVRRSIGEDSTSLDEDKKSLSQETLPLMNKDGIGYKGTKPYLETSLDYVDDDDDDMPKKKYLETSLDDLDKGYSEA